MGPPVPGDLSFFVRISITQAEPAGFYLGALLEQLVGHQNGLGLIAYDAICQTGLDKQGGSKYQRIVDLGPTLLESQYWPE